MRVSSDIFTVFPLFFLFYTLSWKFFELALFPYLSLNLSSGGNCIGDTHALSLVTAGRVFSATLSLSLFTFSLIIFEVAGIFQEDFRAACWRLSLYGMLINLHAVIPGVFLSSLLRSIRLSPTMAAFSTVIFLFLIWWVSNHLQLNLDQPFFSLDAGLTRVGICGISCLAVLSGFGAVNFPFQRLQVIYCKTLTPSTVQKHRWMLQQTLNLIATKKRDLVLNQGGKQSEQAELSALVSLSSSQFLEIVEIEALLETQKQVRHSYVGKINLCLAILAGFFCIYKILSSLRSLAFGRSSSDPITRWLQFGSMNLDDALLSMVSAALIGVLVILQMRGFLITLTNISRTFVSGGIQPPAPLWTLILAQFMGTCFTSSVLLLRVNVPYQYRVAITAALGGTTGHNADDFKFQFYHDWFDTVFIVSGISTVFVLLALRRSYG